MTPRFAPPLAAVAALLWVVPALAADAPAADAPTATAQPDGPSVSDQIAAFLRDSPVARLPADDGPAGVTTSSEPRRPHGVVDVAVGSHGYRSVYVRSDLPVGQTGTLSIAVGESKGGRGFGGGYRFGGAYGVGAGRFGARGLPLGENCRSGVALPDERACLSRSSGEEPRADDERLGVPADPSR